MVNLEGGRGIALVIGKGRGIVLFHIIDSRSQWDFDPPPRCRCLPTGGEAADNDSTPSPLSSQLASELSPPFSPPRIPRRVLLMLPPSSSSEAIKSSRLPQLLSSLSLHVSRASSSSKTSLSSSWSAIRLRFLLWLSGFFLNRVDLAAAVILSRSEEEEEEDEEEEDESESESESSGRRTSN